MFPVGIPPRASDPHRDARGLDTINRLLLHGARYHARAELFVARDTPNASDADDGSRAAARANVPDWEADRLSIRVALVLHEELSVTPGDPVALWMPLSVAWALVERGIWGLGAISVPVPPELGASEASLVLARTRPKVLFVSSVARASALSIPDSVAAVVTLDESASGGFGLALRELLDRGGVLDTPERASGFRSTARQIPAEALASIEPTRAGSMQETTQGGWAQASERFLRRFPPREGERHVIDFGGVERAARIVLYAGWADGLTTVAIGGDGDGAMATGENREIIFSGRGASGSGGTQFANLFEVTGEQNGGAP